MRRENSRVRNEVLERIPGTVQGFSYHVACENEHDYVVPSTVVTAHNSRAFTVRKSTSRGVERKGVIACILRPLGHKYAVHTLLLGK
ncbi:MAG: hypothetical protein NVSMB52_19610 [Chloroflexota bacterium]